MANSLKLNDSKFWDSSSISHNRKQLSNILSTGELVGEAVANGNVKELKVSGLDIKRDGYVYDIVVAEYSTAGTSRGHYLQLNDKGSGYSGRHRYVWSSSPSSWVLTTHSACLAFANGWSMGTPLFYTIGTLVYFNQDWLYFDSQGGTTTTGGNYVDVHCNTYLVNQNQSNVTSIRIVCTDSDYIGNGSWIKVYRRKNWGGVIRSLKNLITNMFNGGAKYGYIY